MIKTIATLTHCNVKSSCFNEEFAQVFNPFKRVTDPLSHKDTDPLGDVMRKKLLFLVIACMTMPLAARKMVPEGERIKLPGGKSRREFFQMIEKERGIIPRISILKKSTELPQLQFTKEQAATWDRGVEELSKFPAKIKALDTDGKIAYMSRQDERSRKINSQIMAVEKILEENLKKTSAKYRSISEQQKKITAKIDDLDKRMQPLREKQQKLYEQNWDLRKKQDAIRKANPGYRKIAALEKQQKGVWEDQEKVFMQIRDKLSSKVRPIKVEYGKKLTDLFKTVMADVKFVGPTKKGPTPQKLIAPAPPMPE